MDVTNTFYHEVDQEVKSRLFCALGTEGKKRFLQDFAHINLATTSFKDFVKHCTNVFREDKNLVVERMHLYNSSQNEQEGLDGFFKRLCGQAAQSGWLVAIEKEVVKDPFIVKMRFKDIQRELCIRPSDSPEKTLKSALFHEKGYATASGLQKQIGQNSSYNKKNFEPNFFEIKQEPTMSIQKKKILQNGNARAQNNKINLKT